MTLFSLPFLWSVTGKTRSYFQNCMLVYKLRCSSPSNGPAHSASATTTTGKALSAHACTHSLTAHNAPSLASHALTGSACLRACLPAGQHPVHSGSAGSSRMETPVCWLVGSHRALSSGIHAPSQLCAEDQWTNFTVDSSSSIWYRCTFYAQHISKVHSPSGHMHTGFGGRGFRIGV